eukprot:g5509.t1
MMSERNLDDNNNPSSLTEPNTSTTNLYVGGLAPDLTEDILKREFGKFGAIASVKIMWPRDEDQIKRGSNVGFVAFMERECAAKCIEKLNGEKLHGVELRIGWGKSVPLPSVPLFSTPQVSPELSPSSSIDPALKQQFPVTVDDISDHDIKVTIPDDNHLRFVIDTTAAYILRDGAKLEQLIKRKETTNPIFSFLYKDGSPDNIYYRWKVFSLSQGDSMKCWRLEPFFMVENGDRWIPPSMCVGDGSQLTAAQKGGEAVGKKKLLSEMERDKLKSILYELTANRGSICEAMVFALNNAEAAEEIVEILAECLCNVDLDITLKIAHLFLVSDILHNSSASVRNASQYRSRLEEKLPDVFESLQQVYSSLNDKKDIQETVKKYVLRVLRIWRNWFLFSNDYLNGLQSTFLTPMESVKADSEHLKKLFELHEDEIERRCRQNGLSVLGGVQQQRIRIARLESYLHGTNASASVSKIQSINRSAKNKPQIKSQTSAKRTLTERKVSEKQSGSSRTSGMKSDQTSKGQPLPQWVTKEKPTKLASKEKTKDPVQSEMLRTRKAEPRQIQINPNEDIDMFEDPDLADPDPKAAGSIQKPNKNSDIQDSKRQKRNDGTKS